MARSEKGHFLIIGGGFAGLATAIELKRKGFSAEVFETAPELSLIGDVIQIGSSATRIISKWGDTLKGVTEYSSRPKTMSIYNSAGELVFDSPILADYDGFPILFSNRSGVQKCFYEYALSIGVTVHLNTRVTEYFENDECAGITIGSKEFKGDAIIACDGIHSYGRRYVTGINQIAQTSGFSVYRSWFPLERLSHDPLTKHFTSSTEEELIMWVGRDTHTNLLVLPKPQGAVVFVTHPDTDNEASESWSRKGSMEDMMKNVEGWDPICRAAVAAVPQEVLIDWKLLWRDPTRKWVSDKGRVVLVGDSAHPHLPTSGTGGVQAIEDAATLVAVLDSLGKEKIPLAFRVFQKLRYERTSLTQRMGWETRHRWHKTDWEAVAKDPAIMKMPQPTWIYGHDAEKYAYDRTAEAAESVEKGTAFQSTNIPEGHVHEDWTVEMMLALEQDEVQKNFYKVANV
ncbi:uncharacterized protein A1O5_01767 [Cladophialophora psammophila CBS 110553]|uniref:FAD-binding domain-containing protein n=1 Tax=Cladophialophora psammophila CBS 110553 TaxID=1182543 RepID=W9XDN2_9EURO|nr:uncharacterized protein A1O5_01767 [Cladophialophora psammophila CBS 110553]EXJ75071.1 hypothetical protein A1O5_01767 [Cladophialophora psammophila CBS 110553]